MAELTINGARLFFEEAGAGGSSFLFVHGGASDHRAWGPQFADLSGDCRCLAVDLRGCGQSDEVGPYTPAQHVADLAEVIRTLGLAPAIVAGHSFGGLYALMLNDAEPSLVNGIVVADTPLRPEGLDPRAVAEALRAEGSTSFLAERFAHPGTPFEVRALIADMAAACPLTVAAEMIESAVFSGDEMLRFVRIADRKPFMALWPTPEDPDDPEAHEGAGDPAWLRENTMFIRQEPVAGAGHFLQLERPEVTNALFRAFLDDVRRDPRIGGAA